MKKLLIILLVVLGVSCKEEMKPMNAQQIVDRSIFVCGGELYNNAKIRFDFRDRSYISEQKGKKKTLKRILKNDTLSLLDVYTSSTFERYENDSLVFLSDSLATIYGNAVNSVHYFSKLPYGLNDNAVKKELLGEVIIRGKSYYKVKVTFDQQGGGDDFDDTYVYFFNQKTFKPDYLAYDFHVNGGGMRFREAFNERYVGGIRFVDYTNMKPKDTNASVLQIDSLYTNNGLELLSKIELKNVVVSASDNYN